MKKLGLSTVVRVPAFYFLIIWARSGCPSPIVAPEANSFLWAPHNGPLSTSRRILTGSGGYSYVPRVPRKLWGANKRRGIPSTRAGTKLIPKCKESYREFRWRLKVLTKSSGHHALDPTKSYGGLDVVSTIGADASLATLHMAQVPAPHDISYTNITKISHPKVKPAAMFGGRNVSHYDDDDAMIYQEIEYSFSANSKDISETYAVKLYDCLVDVLPTELIALNSNVCRVTVLNFTWQPRCRYLIDD